MLNRGLLRDAVVACGKARAPIGPVFLQRRIRVGSVTAAQLIDALAAAGVVGPYQGVRRGRPVLVTDQAAADALIAAAIADGRIALDVDDPTEWEIHDSHQPEPDGVRIYPGGQSCQRCCRFVAFEGSRYRVTAAGAEPCQPGSGKVELR